jgi:hypothetical protein
MCCALDHYLFLNNGFVEKSRQNHDVTELCCPFDGNAETEDDRWIKAMLDYLYTRFQAHQTYTGYYFPNTDYFGTFEYTLPHDFSTAKG